MTSTPTTSLTAKTIGEIVADDYRTAAVFEKHGIDFCCGGKSPLAVVCKEQGVDPAAIAREVDAVKSTPADRSQNYSAWSLSFLADYIVNTHHVYLNESTPQIAGYAHKIAQVHGANHPEVVEIASIFDKVATSMAAHLREEEEVFFPAIRRVEACLKSGKAADVKDLEALHRSFLTLNREHEEIGEATHRIRQLARGYAIPPDVCNTFMVTYQKLREFEDDLHKHVHLENNILFPKALRLR